MTPSPSRKNPFETLQHPMEGTSPSRPPIHLTPSFYEVLMHEDAPPPSPILVSSVNPSLVTPRNDHVVISAVRTNSAGSKDGGIEKNHLDENNHKKMAMGGFSIGMGPSVDIGGTIVWEKGNWKLHRSIFQQLDTGPWGGPEGHTLDLFATSVNKQTPRFCSALESDSTTSLGNAYSIPDWSAENAWCNPPWTAIPTILDRILKDGATLTLIAPVWSNAPWYTRVLALCIDSPRLIRHEEKTFSKNGDEKNGIFGPPNWDHTAAFTISGVPSLQDKYRTGLLTSWQKYPNSPRRVTGHDLLFAGTIGGVSIPFSSEIKIKKWHPPPTANFVTSDASFPTDTVTTDGYLDITSLPRNEWLDSGVKHLRWTSKPTRVMTAKAQRPVGLQGGSASPPTSREAARTTVRLIEFENGHGTTNGTNEQAWEPQITERDCDPENLSLHGSGLPVNPLTTHLLPSNPDKLPTCMAHVTEDSNSGSTSAASSEPPVLSPSPLASSAPVALPSPPTLPNAPQTLPPPSPRCLVGGEQKPVHAAGKFNANGTHCRPQIPVPARLANLFEPLYLVGKVKIRFFSISQWMYHRHCPTLLPTTSLLPLLHPTHL